MIRTYRDRDTDRLAARQRVKKWSPKLSRAAPRKLRMLDAAEELIDLRVPSGNRLERLEGNRQGQHSIRLKTSGGSASAGRLATPTTSRSWTPTTRWS